MKKTSLSIQAFLICTSRYSLYYVGSIACSYSLYASDRGFHTLFLWGVESSMVSSPSSGIDEMSRELTPLQKHVQFFDRNGDGIVYPRETYQGFRAIGFGVCFSALSALFINTILSSRTLPTGQKRSCRFPIYIWNIKQAKHGSDSGVYDEEGRFVDWKFEELFRKHALTHAYSLTSNELSQMLKANREPKDYKGWIGGFTEWKTLYQLCKDENGLLHKDDIRAAYDGTLFHRIEKQRISNGLKK